ncbi:hypothetical protein SAMN05444920_101599 [Nonomuraea solani]|uniref:Uncharacterized protein n=1 Tax=Nonomuraea solani TaxID=1144553 RepID=A0A1H5URD7_9ACTN|nr:hypothetical protein [Nonomuraea solani]SEF77001.1 hypothetical protein SAMN05444920_101599 [Nonomuraea solani]
MVVNSSGVDSQAGGSQMSNVTRYLSAAAYLDSGFRDRVLGELLFDPYRAVPPSYGGFDVMPVLHHCRRSRSMLLVRDGLITAFFVIGLVMAPLPTIAWLSALLPFVLLTVRAIRRGPLFLRVLIWLWAGYSVFSLFVGLVLVDLGRVLGRMVGGGFTGGSSEALFAAGLGSLVQALVIPVATLGVALVYRFAVYMTLAGSLRPGAPEPVTPAGDDRTGRRLDYLRRAQWGNVTMYDNEDAFMGAGSVRRSWSIAVELDRVRGEAGGERRDEPVDIDPVDLHGFVRERLAEMRDRVLRPNEGIQRLDIGDHVVTRGLFTVADWHRDRKVVAHPFIGQDGLPRFMATPEEIAAIARHPQGGVRYYQRVTINNAGQEIRDLRGNLVAPAEDQEALTSAFIYLAVEGRMLYTQFVVTVLPPAYGPYHVVDRLPTMTGGRIAWESVRMLRLELLRDVLAAPVRVVRAGVQAIRQSAMTPDPRKHIVYPYGAGFSVRQLGADEELQTYIQVLDVNKYTKMIEQRLTEAVLDFLEERGIETGAYRLQAAGVITDNSVNVNVQEGGVFSGAMGVGQNASATVNKRA